MDSAVLGGFGGSLDVEVRGNHKTELTEAAQRVHDALEGSPDAPELTSDLAPEQPTLQVAVDRTEAMENGYSEMQFLGMVSGILSLQSVGSLTMDGEEFNIYVETDTAPETLSELRELQLPTETGMVRLEEMAGADDTNVTTSVTRRDGDLVAAISLTQPMDKWVP